MTWVADERSNSQSIINNLISRASKDLDPTMVTVLQEITNELKNLNIAVYGPPIVISSKGQEGQGIRGAEIGAIRFEYLLTSLNVILQWNPPSGDFYYYELRKGNDWTTATRLLTTNNSQVVLEPLLVGHHTYLLRTIDSDGVMSEGISRVDIDIPPISDFKLNPVVVENALTMSWSIPTSTFKIDHYEIKRNGVLITTTTGTFFAGSENVGGSYVYSVVAIDVAGNKSPEISANLVLKGATDFTFYSKLTSTLNGTIVNGKKSGNQIYFNILNETYQNHFSSRGWASPQSQVSAGYDPWLSPFALTGSYEETFDLGVIVTNVVITLSWAYQIYFGAFTYGLQSRYSNDNISYSAIETAQSFYAPSLRYLKIKMNFTAGDDKALLSFKEFSASLNLKKENDGGEGTSLASDSLGTVVNFNKTFIDVDAITVTPVSTTSTFATHEFTDVKYPTSFKVRIYDNSGVRITKDFRWNARGIV